VERAAEAVAGARRPAMNGGGGGSGSGGEGCGSAGEDEGATQSLWVCFYRARRGEGASAGSNGHQWPWRPAAFNAFKGEA
jgi:hypothetical protein